jgi:hypothetical protein
LVKIFGPSITFDSFFSNDWTKRVTIEELKTAFDNKKTELATMRSIPFNFTSKSPFLPQKTITAGAKSRRKKRGSKPAKKASAYKKTRSSRK